MISAVAEKRHRVGVAGGSLAAGDGVVAAGDGAVAADQRLANSAVVEGTNRTSRCSSFSA